MNLIERVSRAIDADAWRAIERGMIPERLVESAKGDLLARARLAISAMAEPTEEMLEAGDACDGFTRYDDNASARTHWEAMIQAALTPPR